jgi:hypothetical protein
MPDRNRLYFKSLLPTGFPRPLPKIPWLHRLREEKRVHQARLGCCVPPSFGSSLHWVASQQATHSFFLCLSPKIHRLLVLKPKHRRSPAGIRQLTVCVGCYLQEVALLTWLRKPRCHSQFQFLFEAALLTWLPARGNSTVFSVVDSQEEAAASTTADGVGEASMTAVRGSKKKRKTTKF